MIPQPFLPARPRVILEILPLEQQLHPPPIHAHLLTRRIPHLSHTQLALSDAVRGKVHNIALTLIPQHQRIRISRRAKLLGRGRRMVRVAVLLLMTFQIFGRDVAEVRIAYCVALRRAACERGETAEITEP